MNKNLLRSVVWVAGCLWLAGCPLDDESDGTDRETPALDGGAPLDGRIDEPDGGTTPIGSDGGTTPIGSDGGASLSDAEPGETICDDGLDDDGNDAIDCDDIGCAETDVCVTAKLAELGRSEYVECEEPFEFDATQLTEMCDRARTASDIVNDPLESLGFVDTGFGEPANTDCGLVDATARVQLYCVPGVPEKGVLVRFVASVRSTFQSVPLSDTVIQDVGVYLDGVATAARFGFYQGSNGRGGGSDRMHLEYDPVPGAGGIQRVAFWEQPNRIWDWERYGSPSKFRFAIALQAEKVTDTIDLESAPGTLEHPIIPQTEREYSYFAALGVDVSLPLRARASR